MDSSRTKIFYKSSTLKPYRKRKSFKSTTISNEDEHFRKSIPVQNNQSWLKSNFNHRFISTIETPSRFHSDYSPYGKKKKTSVSQHILDDIKLHIIEREERGTRCSSDKQKKETRESLIGKSFSPKKYQRRRPNSCVFQQEISSKIAEKKEKKTICTSRLCKEGNLSSIRHGMVDLYKQIQRQDMMNNKQKQRSSIGKKFSWECKGECSSLFTQSRINKTNASITSITDPSDYCKAEYWTTMYNKNINRCIKIKNAIKAFPIRQTSNDYCKLVKTPRDSLNDINQCIPSGNVSIKTETTDILQPSVSSAGANKNKYITYMECAKDPIEEKLRGTMSREIEFTEDMNKVNMASLLEQTNNGQRCCGCNIFDYYWKV